MVNLSTKYMGLELINPIIVGSSSLTNTPEKIKKCEEAGAGAVVLKSLFEEQIYEEKVKTASKDMQDNAHAEALEYIRQMSMEHGPEDYLKLIRDSKKTVKIPVIASLNCSTDAQWEDYAQRIEKAGADAIELNISWITSDVRISGADIEERLVNISKNVKKSVNIPVSVKIGPYFAAVPNLARQLSNAGINAIVIFNRFYQMKTNIDTMALEPAHSLSGHDELYLPLRFVALLAGKLDCDICGTRGVQSGDDVIRFLLAGANATQVCSVLYRNKVEYIRTMLQRVEDWMKAKEFESIKDFRGNLSQKNIPNPWIYERQQYIKALVGIE